MKKLMFAFACAASVCAFADGTAIGFEEFISGTTLVGNRNDSGANSGPYYWSYERASGSTDGSVVKAYGVNDNLPDFDYTKLLPAAFVGDETNDQYLELSTEGGTLWRNFTTAGTGGAEGTPFEGENTLGAPVPLNDFAAEGQNIYVDTLVQFTPTEDGTPPVVSSEDQMAIWLNVTTPENDPDHPVTNLCVLAACYIDGGLNTHTYMVPDANNGGIDVVPGQWYRLTVKAINNLVVEDGQTYWPGFKIYLDGRPLKTDTPTFEESVAELLDGTFNDVSMSEVANGSVFLSLWALPESTQNPSIPSFKAVGFKGSGAIDDLVVSTDVPNFFESAGALDFILKWDANVSAVSYTLGGIEYPVEDLAALTQTISLEDGVTSVEIKATPKDWYKVTGGTGTTTINEAGQEITVTTSDIDSPIADELIADVKAWAKSFATALTPAEIAACGFAKNAYLMNTDLSAEPGLEITSITEVEGGWQITVKGTQGDTTVPLNGIRGQLQIKAAATLDALDAAEPIVIDVPETDEAGVATVTVAGDKGNFMKAKITAKPAPVTPAAE